MTPDPIATVSVSMAIKSRSATSVNGDHFPAAAPKAPAVEATASASASC
jgi:hypothetical protein